jgi:DNA mismatch repair protein PMS2
MWNSLFPFCARLISFISQTGLEQLYEPSRSTYLDQSLPTPPRAPTATNKRKEQPLFLEDDDDDDVQQARPSAAVPQAASVQRPSASFSKPTEKIGHGRDVIPSRSRGRSPLSTTPSLSRMAPRPTGAVGIRSSTLNSPDSTQNRNLPITHFFYTPKKTLEYEEEDENEEDGFSQDEEVRLVLDSERSDLPIVTKPTKRLLQTTPNDAIQRHPAGASTSASQVSHATNDGPVGAASSRSRLRHKIAGFASQGAVVDLDELNSDTDGEGQQVESSALIDQARVDETPRDLAHARSEDIDDETAQQSKDEMEMQTTSDASSRPRTGVEASDADKDRDSDIVMETQEDVIELEEDVSGHVINNNQYINQGSDEDITYIADSQTVIAEDAGPSDFRNEILKASPQGEIIMRCDIKRIRTRAKRRLELDAIAARNKKRKLDETDMLPEAGIANTDTAQVDRVLSRVIQKEDFAKMDILGQYNLAFIIARRKKPEENGQTIDDIFIIGKLEMCLVVVLN